MSQLSNVYNVIFFLSSLDSGPRFISMSLLALELKQVLFISNLTRHPEIGIAQNSRTAVN